MLKWCESSKNRFLTYNSKFGTYKIFYGDTSQRWHLTGPFGLQTNLPNQMEALEIANQWEKELESRSKVG